MNQDSAHDAQSSEESFSVQNRPDRLSRRGDFAGKRRVFRQEDRGSEAVVPADLNQPDEHGQTLLMREAEAGSLEAVKALIAAGTDVNAADKSGQTPLIWPPPVPALRTP